MVVYARVIAGDDCCLSCVPRVAVAMESIASYGIGSPYSRFTITDLSFSFEMDRCPSKSFTHYDQEIASLRSQ
jgi:hypothetical protein